MSLADDGALSAAELPSDTLVALRLLRSQFPRGGGCDALPRLLLVSQLYSLVSDRAAVDRELAALARAGAIRRFKLATGRDEYAFLLADDYAALIAEARRAAAADRGLPPAALAAAFDGFAQRVLPACPDAAAVAAAALRDLLRRPARPDAQPLPERDVDDAVAALMHAGLVTRAMTPGADALLFSAPGTARFIRVVCLWCVWLRHCRAAWQGAFQRALQRGRAALRQALARKTHRQALRADVERLKLRGCALPASFLVRDMIGSGALSAAQVATGTLLRLVDLN
jgi:serine/threonine-protein kinase 19